MAVPDSGRGSQAQEFLLSSLWSAETGGWGHARLPLSINYAVLMHSLHRCFLQFDVKFALLLTGTPVQNNLNEVVFTNSYSCLSWSSC